MAVLQGAAIKIFINEALYPQAEAFSYSLDYGERPIYGIDIPFPQEIHNTQASINGSIQGIRLSNSGGLQAVGARPKYNEILRAPYVSIRIQDRKSEEDLIFIPQAKISNQSVSATATGLLRLSFNFVGLIGLEPLDRSDSSGVTIPKIPTVF